MAETKLIRDHHLLTRNLKLNSNAITNNSVMFTEYTTGTAAQSGTNVTGSGTAWTSGYIGREFVWADGTTSGLITELDPNNDGSQTMVVTVSQTVSAGTSYTISAETGLTLKDDGATTILSDTVNDDILKLVADSVIQGNALRVLMGDTSTGTADKSMCNLDFVKTGITHGSGGSPTINKTTGFNIILHDEAENTGNGLIWMIGVGLKIIADYPQPGVFDTLLTGFDIEVGIDEVTTPATCTGVKTTVNNGGYDLKMYSSTSLQDFGSIRTDANGETYIETNDHSTGVLAHINLIADGNVAIKCNPGGTIKLLENDDTTFTPSDAADIATKAYVDAQTHLILIDEDNMATDSATRPPSQQSVKAYVDSLDTTSAATASNFAIAMAIALG